MNLTSRTARRVTAAAGLISAALLVPAVALAAPGQSATTARTAAPAACTAGDLVTWVGIPGDGAAGSTHFQLELSNISHHACTLFGYPGVSAAGKNGRQVGSAAVRNRSHPVRLITIGRGATAHVELGITDVGVYSRSACHPVTATGLRVYAPNAFGSQVVPFAFRACQRRGPRFLQVSAAIGGTGVPLFSS
jgi:hypothetical protein